MQGNRKSIRLKNYDYAQNGAYYLTICAQSRECLFGDVKGSVMVLNDAGKMVDKWWQKLPDKYAIEIDAYRIMPNHLHGIINIVGAHPCVRPDNNGYDSDSKGRVHVLGQTHGSAPTTTVGMIVQWFKTMLTNEYIRNVKNNNWPAFNEYLWQRNYYEHIIRGEADLNRIREYIINNPADWDKDEYYVT